MVNLDITTRTTGGGDYRWLGSNFSRDTADPATINVALLEAGTHYDENGVIPSGLPLGKVTATGLYGPYDPDATDGRDVLAGFNLEPESLATNGFNASLPTQVSIALLEIGQIVVAFVPTQPVLNVGIKTTGMFQFRGADYSAETP